MIELLALDATDGLLFYRDRGSIYSRRLRDETPRQVSEAMVARAVCDHGFVARSEQFESVKAMLDDVRGEVREKIPPQPPHELAVELLKVAPPSVLKTLIERTKRELLPQNLDAAERLIRAMLKHARRLDGTPELKARAETLLEEVRNLRPPALLEYGRSMGDSRRRALGGAPRSRPICRTRRPNNDGDHP